MPRGYHWVVLAGMYVVPVEAVGAVKLLALKLILLEVRAAVNATDDSAVWVVVGNLLDGPGLVHHHAVTALIVLYIVMAPAQQAVGE